MEICKVNNCGREVYAKSMCASHNSRFNRTGDANEMVPIKNIKMSLIDRFKEKIAPKNSNGCMEWMACLSDNRYGAFITGSRTKRTRKRYIAHRLSYELFVGAIPKGKCVLHKCDNPKCVNPEHLFLGTQSDNMKDMIKKGRDFHVALLGSKHGNAKLNEEQVMEIKDKIKNGISLIELSKIYNVSPENISSIKRGKTWKHIG